MATINKKIGWEISRKSFLPILLFFLIIVSYVNYKTKIVPLISAELQQELSRYLRTIFAFSAALIIHRVGGTLLFWYKENIAAKTTTKLDDKLVPLAERAFKVAVWVIALLVILPFYGVNITALVAALGVGSLAIALAAKDTIANIIAGFLIMIDSPFRVGDKIKIPSGEIVEVLDVGVRRCKFLAEDNSIIIVPNLNLSKNKIVNYTYGAERTRRSE